MYLFSFFGGCAIPFDPFLDISRHSMPQGYSCGACQTSKLKCKWPPGSRMAHTHSESLKVMWELIKSQENMTCALDHLNFNLEHVRISVDLMDDFSDGEMKEDEGDSVEELVEEESEKEEEEGEMVVPSGSSHYKKRKLKSFLFLFLINGVGFLNDQNEREENETGVGPEKEKCICV